MSNFYLIASEGLCFNNTEAHYFDTGFLLIYKEGRRQELMFSAIECTGYTSCKLFFAKIGLFLYEGHFF
jgi:hypothetical protein